MSDAIYIAKNGGSTGPYTEQQLLEQIRTGTLGPNDTMWKEGMSAWQTLNSIFPAAFVGTTPPPIPVQNATDSYQTVADTIGCVPSLRWKDNLIQAAVTLGCTAIGALIGGLGWGMEGCLLGLTAGLIVGGLGSGFVLMVQGWIRASKN